MAVPRRSTVMQRPRGVSARSQSSLSACRSRNQSATQSPRSALLVSRGRRSSAGPSCGFGTRGREQRAASQRSRGGLRMPCRTGYTNTRRLARALTLLASSSGGHVSWTLGGQHWGWLSRQLRLLQSAARHVGLVRQALRWVRP